MAIREMEQSKDIREIKNLLKNFTKRITMKTITMDYNVYVEEIKNARSESREYADRRNAEKLIFLLQDAESLEIFLEVFDIKFDGEKIFWSRIWKLTRNVMDKFELEQVCVSSDIPLSNSSTS